MTVDQDVASMIDNLSGLLTMVARATLHDQQQYDFASVLTGSLAAAAANVGGPDALLAGRPGSWEAAYIRDLLRGAMGDCPRHWWTFTTEPAIVGLNVAELVEDSDLHPGLVGLDEARDNLDHAFGDRSDEDRLAQDYSAALRDLDGRYAESYALYAKRFASAVEAAGHDLDLPPSPRIIVDDDPESAWWDNDAIHNPTAADSALVCELWERAHAMVPLPNVDIRRINLDQ